MLLAFHTGSRRKAGKTEAQRPRGLLPIPWSTGTASEMMYQIAAPMVGRMVSSTAVTLIVIGKARPLLARRCQQRKSVHAAIIGVADYFGALHVLVNNAGIAGVNKPTHEVTKDEWDRVQAVNVKGVG